MKLPSLRTSGCMRPLSQVKASALYITTVMAVVIAFITGGAILSGLYHNIAQKKYTRHSKLLSNLESGIELALADSSRYNAKRFDLYGSGLDSVEITTRRWGLYDLALVRSFEQTDTIEAVFLVGRIPARPGIVLEIADEGRPVSVAGTALINGDAALPESGIRRATVDGQRYIRDRLVYGKLTASSKHLPKLDSSILIPFRRLLRVEAGSVLPKRLEHSFAQRTQTFKVDSVLQDVRLKGNIILVSDTVLRISKSAILEDIIIQAPAVIVAEGFVGSCQIFATDSVITEKQVTFNYPSSLVVDKISDHAIVRQPFISLGRENSFSGIVCTYEQNRSSFRTRITLEKNTRISGEVYASGFLRMEYPVEVFGKVSTERVFVKTPVSLYDNYLFNITFDAFRRDNNYMTTGLFVPAANRGVLKWVK